VLAVAHGYVALFAGIALWGLHMGMTQGLLAALVADTTPATYRGTAFGVFNLASGIALLAASAAAGALWDAFGPWAAFAAGGALCVVSAVLALRRPVVATA
jgi:MFS family permease